MADLIGLSDEQAGRFIKAAYRNIMLVSHPDQGGDTIKSTLINEAYGYLKDTHNRSSYCAKG